MMWTFFGFTISMLVGSYLAGSIPLACNFSEAKLKQVSILGAGLLVGTVLTVIIPEGVHAMYSDVMHSSSHTSSPVHTGPAPAINEHVHHERPPIHPHHSAGAAGAAGPAPGPGVAAMRKISEINSAVKGGVDTGAVGAAVLPNVNPASEAAKGHSEHDDDVHQVIGLVLLLGFIFMLVIDQMTGHPRSPDKNITATLGLVVHAAADGVALGAASSTSHLRVELIVFFAIMLHKGPAAFGLVTILLRDGADRTRIRKHLLLFSLAAPVLAVITYFGLSQRSKDSLDTMNATGIAMLFSAGTFLYVATVHVLPELEAKNCSSSGSLPGSSPSDDHRRGFSRCDIIILLIGSCLPLVLSLGHSHHH